jgi:outer membrane protein assembly factor BamB
MLHAPLVALVSLLSSGDAAHWPAWRGPSGNGVAPGAAARAFGDGQGVRWKVAVPGRGMSTPIVLGDALYLSTASPGGDGEEQSFELHCLERKTGATRWKAVAKVATPHEGFHKSYGSYASASPVTDGERVYVSFGTQGVFAYGLDGKLVWSFDAGVKLAMRNAFGEGLAPVLAGDVLVQVADQENGSFAFGLDKKSGKELWRVPRDEPSTWATPLVTELGGALQVVTSGVKRTRSYEPATGKLLWEAPGAGLNAIPTVLRHQDLVFVMSGHREAKILALDLGKDGPGKDVKEPPTRWTSTKGCGYTASPVLAGGLYYTVTDRGLISCFDAATGEAHYMEERLPRGSALKSSPIAAGDFLYVPTEAGEVHLVKLGPKYEVAATNTFAEQVFIASPAWAEGDLYLRSVTHLLCVGGG